MQPTQKLVRCAAAAALFASVFSAQAAHAADAPFDSAAVEAGGGEHLQVLRLSAQKDWNRNWLPAAGYHLSGYWDANAAFWRANRWQDEPGNSKNLAVVGITPVFRRRPSNSPTTSAPAMCSTTSGNWACASSIIRTAASSIRTGA